jgi:hypothetical protein
MVSLATDSRHCHQAGRPKTKFLLRDTGWLHHQKRQYLRREFKLTVSWYTHPFRSKHSNCSDCRAAFKLDVSVTSGGHAYMGGSKSLFALLPAGIVKLGAGEKGATQSTGVELRVRLRVCSTILHILLERGRNLPSQLERTLFIQTCSGTQLLLPSLPDR